MRTPWLLSRYFSGQFVLAILATLAVVLLITYAFDTVELLRRSAERPNIGFDTVLSMGLLKLPGMSERILPFAVLIGAMTALARLLRTHELIVTRASGISVWQFLLPPLAMVMLLGIIYVTCVNPLAAATTSRYEQMEAKYFEDRMSTLAVSSSGLWLRETDNVKGVRSENILHARKVSQDSMELSDVIIFVFGADHVFQGRIDARTARLETGAWRLADVLITAPNRVPRREAEMQLRTTLTLGQIQDSFASPETMSFWELPGFIQTLQNAGFSALRHRLHWYALMASPLLLCAMVLIAAVATTRNVRQKQGKLVLWALAAGFLLYFLRDVMTALGASGTLPVELAAWTPALATTFIGLALLLHFEDG